MQTEPSTARATTDPRQAAAVAAEFDTLRGYSGVWAGVGMLVFALLWGAAGPGVAPGLALLLIVAVSLPLTERWYDRRFGRTRTGWRRNAVAAVFAVVAVVVLMAALGWDHFERPPVLLSLLAAAGLWWVGSWLAARRLGLTAVDHAVPVAVALAALAPLAGVVPEPLRTVPYVFAVLGLALVVGGYAAHRRLLALLGAPDAQG